MRANLGVGKYESTSGNNSTFAYFCIIKNGAAHTNKATFPKSTSVHSSIMTYGHIILHNSRTCCIGYMDNGTILHVAVDGEYLGHIIIADMMKDDAKQAIDNLHAAGVKKTVMLTGDREEVAAAVADQLGIDEFHAQLMPQDKMAHVEKLLDRPDGRGNVAFVGDGINDAPVLMRADVGIAMGAMGSDAAIEAADIVLMNDNPARIARAVHIARKTMRIVHQNIAFALAVKIVIMILALPMIGISTMWLAVFGDVGVSVIAILNAMRCLGTRP